MVLKVLHCPAIVGGNAFGLAQAEREIGLDSISAILQETQNPYAYKVDLVIGSTKRTLWSSQLARWKMILCALRFDVIHYNFGQPIMPDFASRSKESQGILAYIKHLIYLPYAYVFQYFDMRIFKLLKKVIIVTYQGDDARQGDYCREHYTICIANEVDDKYYSKVSDELKRKMISKMMGYADFVYALNPDLLQVLPGAEFLPYAHLNLSEWAPCDRKIRVKDSPIVVHAPSNRQAKGTRYVLDAVDKLINEGVDFQFKLVEGLTNTEAKILYREADVLVDQLLAGWYGGLAVELMALGKPVICYIRDEDLINIPQKMKQDLPIIQATPDSIYKVLKHYLTTGRKDLLDIGVKSRKFVETWHDSVKVARQTKKKYEDLIKNHRS